MAAQTAPLVLIGLAQQRPFVRALCDGSVDVVEVGSAAQVIKRVRDLLPDAILLDADLPNGGGIEVCRRLREGGFVGEHVPVLVLAQERPTPEQRVLALRAGAWDFLRYPGDLEEFKVRLDAYVLAKRHADAVREDGGVDPDTGLQNRVGLARRARELGGLLARRHGAMACVVFAMDAPSPVALAGLLLSRSTRISDVVGTLGPHEIAVLTPETSAAGAVAFARRVAAVLEAGVPAEQSCTPGATLHIGYDAVSNLRYSPMDPAELLVRASLAVRQGTPEADCPWVSRYAVGARRTPAEGSAVPAGIHGKEGSVVQ